MTASSPTFEVLLEKRSRGRILSMSRSWALRTIRLSRQTLSYFDGNDLKGSVDISGASLKLIAPSDADSKSFPFEIDIGSEKLLFNASCAETRSKCVEIFSLAARTAAWDEIQIDQMKKQMQERESTLTRSTTITSSPSSSSTHKMSDVFDSEREDLVNERKRLEERNQVLVNERKAFEQEKTEVRNEKYQIEKQIKDAERARIEKEKIQFLKEGMALPQNQYLQSQNGVYYALMQGDGNFVVYVSRHAVPANLIWSTNTIFDEEDGPYCMILREDGRLALIDVTCSERWSSGTVGQGDSSEHCLKLEDDGNLVIRDGSDRIIWQSHSSRGDPTLLLPI